MTYQEIKDRLEKCENSLKSIQDGTFKATKEVDIKETMKKLQLLQESLKRQLKEADKGTVMTKDISQAEKLADKGVNVHLTKEQDGIEFNVEETKAIAKEVGKAVAKSLKTLGDEIAHMKAHSIEPNSFEIHVEYKKDTSVDDFSFYISGDKLHLTDFSFDKEIGEVGVKPSGEPIVHVDVIANELVKHFKSLSEGMSDQEFADAKEKERLEKHPERDMIKKIQALIQNANKNEEYADYKPGSIAPKDLYYSDKHGKLVAMDDVDDKYHDRLKLVYRKGDKIEGPMDEGEYAADKHNVNVYGYQTMHFDICPGAKSLFDRVIKDGSIKDKEGLKRLAELHDILFTIEKIALKDSNRAKQLLDRAIKVASNIYVVGNRIGLDQNTDLSYIQSHIEKINDAAREEEVNEDINLHKIEVSIRDAKKAQDIMYDMYDRQFEQNGSNVYLFDDEQTAYDAMMDLTSRGVEVENIEDFDEAGLTEMNKDEMKPGTYAGRAVVVHMHGPETEWKVEFVKSGKVIDYADAISNLKFDDDTHPTDYMQRRKAEKDYQQENALGFSDIEKFGSKAASDIDISVRRDPNYTFGKRPGDDDRLRYKYAKQLGYLSEEDDLAGEDPWVKKQALMKKLAAKYGTNDPVKLQMLIDKFGLSENEAEDQGGDLDIGHQDDEPDMLKQYAYDIAHYAAKLYKQLDKYDKVDAEVDFPNWWQSKVILAKDYISKAQHYLEFEEKQPAIDQLALEGKKLELKEEDRDNPYTDYRDNSDGMWDAPKDYVHNIWRIAGIFGIDSATKKKNKAELIAAIEKFGYKYEVWKNEDIYYYVDGRTRPKKEDAEKINQIRDKHAKQERADYFAKKKSSKKVKPQKLSKLTKGGNTYKVGEDDPNDDGTITSIEKYPNGYFINGVVYGDDDGDKYEKEGYGYAIDLDGNEMPEEDLEGMFEGKYKSDAQRKAIHAKKAELKEGTDLYDRNGIQITRFSGGNRGVMVQINYGGNYIHVPAGEYPFLVRAMQSVQDDLKDLSRQRPRAKNMNELFGSNLNYDDIIGPIVKRLQDLKKYVSKKEPDAMDDLQQVIRAFEIFDEKMAYGTHMELEEGQAAIKKQLDKIDQALKQHKDTTISIVRKDANQRTEDEKAHLAKMADLTKKKKELLDKYGDAVAGINRNQELDETEAKPIPDTILRGYNVNVKNAQTMAQAMLSLFNQINSKESFDFTKHSAIKRVLDMLDRIAKTTDTETPGDEASTEN